MNKNLLTNLIIAFLSALSFNTYAQPAGVSINNTNTPADPSAALDVSSTSAPYAGVLIPRMTTVNRNSIISPATGLLVFNTDCGVTEYYTGSCWLSMNKGLRMPNPISSSGSTDLCGYGARTFTIAPVTGATDYQWTVPPGAVITSGQGTATINVTLGNRSGDVCVTAGNVCETSDPRCLEIYISAVPPFNITNSGPICAGNTLSFNASNIVGGNYQWTGPNGFTSNLQNPSIPNATAAATGTYSVTATLDGCTSLPQTTLATVYPIPATPAISAGQSPACIGTTLNLTTSLVSGATYSWTGPNGFSESSQNVSISNFQSNQAGNYDLTVTVNGCTSPAGSINIQASDVPATPGSISGNTSVNSNQTGVIYSISPVTYATTYTWTVFAGATIASGQGTSSITVDFTNTTGNITVTAGNSCGTSAAATIAVSQGPPASCLAIKQANPSATDGFYTVDPDGNGSIPPSSCYCDMTTDGGGWTLWAAMLAGGTSTTSTITPSSNNYMDNTRYTGLYAISSQIRVHGQSTGNNYYTGKTEALAAVCQNLSTSTPENVGGSYNTVYGHTEVSGCNLTGSDYGFLIIMSYGIYTDAVSSGLAIWHFGSASGPLVTGSVYSTNETNAELYIR